MQGTRKRVTHPGRGMDGGASASRKVPSLGGCAIAAAQGTHLMRRRQRRRALVTRLCLLPPALAAAAAAGRWVCASGGGRELTTRPARVTRAAAAPRQTTSIALRKCRLPPARTPAGPQHARELRLIQGRSAKRGGRRNAGGKCSARGDGHWAWEGSEGGKS